jgi:hypothetical protein
LETITKKNIMFFSRLLLNGNLHLKPTGLVPPTSFGYVRTHNVNMELNDQHYITERFLVVKVSHIESEAPLPPPPKNSKFIVWLYAM